jgi:hypothetical protein
VDKPGNQSAGKSSEVSEDIGIPNPGYRGSRAGRYGTGPSRGPQGMDPDTRRLMMFAAGLGGLLVVLVGASALVGHHNGQVPVITADANPVREKPPNPGGMKIDGAENDVFSGGSDTDNAKLAPAAEIPNTKALRTAETQPESAATKAVAPPVPRTVPESAAESTPEPARAKTAAIAPPPAPATRPVVAAPVVATTVPATKPTPAKPSVAAAEAHSAGTEHHNTSVQLAALASEEAARAEWQRLSKHMPNLLNGRQPSYTRTQVGGRTFWRLRTTGFTDVEQARAFCNTVHAKGGGCTVADF